MLLRLIAPCATLALLAAVPAAAADPDSGWTFATTAASVHVTKDRDHLVVCDNKADNLYAEAEYATSMLGTYTVADSNGAKWGCGEDSTYISRINVFKLCTGIRGVMRRCEDSVWTDGR